MIYTKFGTINLQIPEYRYCLNIKTDIVLIFKEHFESSSDYLLNMVDVPLAKPVSACPKLKFLLSYVELGPEPLVSSLSWSPFHLFSDILTLCPV